MTECTIGIRTDLIGEGWELVDVLAGVLAAGDAEAKLKVEALQELLPEVVPLNHAEVIDGDVTHGELDTWGGKKWKRDNKQTNKQTNK